MHPLIKKLGIVVGIVMISTMILYGLYTKGFFLPDYIEWKDVQIQEDVNEDGQDEIYILKDKKVTVQFGNMEYKLDSQWYVSDMVIQDIDEDGTREILMLVWNRMNYGDYTPFWEKNDRFHFSQHLYVFIANEDSLHAKWMSSKLIPNVKNWNVHLDNTIELIDPDNDTSSWKWSGFGFERIDQ